MRTNGIRAISSPECGPGRRAAWHARNGRGFERGIAAAVLVAVVVCGVCGLSLPGASAGNLVSVRSRLLSEDASVVTGISYSILPRGVSAFSVPAGVKEIAGSALSSSRQAHMRDFRDGFLNPEKGGVNTVRVTIRVSGVPSDSYIDSLVPFYELAQEVGVSVRAGATRPRPPCSLPAPHSFLASPSPERR